MLDPTALACLVALALPAPADLRAEFDAIVAKESAALGALGGDSAATARALRESPPARDGSSRFVPLGEIIPAGKPLENSELRAIRLDAARSSFDLATRALKASPPRLALADEALRAVVARDPGHAEAHRLLGYVPHEGGWATPFAVQNLRNGLTLHPTFGWVAKDWVSHLDRGELPAPYEKDRPTRWLPASEANALRLDPRRDLEAGWRINTAHFAIRTNAPLAEAIAFGRHLEDLRELFGSILADLIGPDLPLAQLARNPRLAPGLPKRLHQVRYFASKDEFVDHLAPVLGPSVGVSLGIYLPAEDMRAFGADSGMSFFYRDPGGQLEATETLFHEGSHQLLFEMTAGKFDPSKPGFWVFEGLGNYFETVRPQPDGSLRFGGLVGKRLAVARARIIGRRESIPISRMASWNRTLFMGGNGGDVRLNYAEAMAIAVFLMQAEDARYREGFLDYARTIYKTRARTKSLEDRLGVPFEDLDRAFLAYLRDREP